jgi:hypothetical protein
MLDRTRRVQLFTLLAFALSLAPHGARTALADDARCFPETGQCISGRFHSFWEENGGLAVFGYPIAALLTDQDDVYPGEQASQIAAWLLQDPKAVERLFAQPVEA